MINRDIYQKDPASRKLVNEGVASVNDDSTRQALAVLRYELETFVCDGQYEKGMEHILETYLKNIDQAQQPAVWVSGFYGSGKSHLVKMLRALWVDTPFDDGATARGIAVLPPEIRDHLRELSVRAKSHGGLHAASGTLGASASGSVRLALLSIIFKSAGLPALYPLARFVMWLRREGIHDEVRAIVERNGLNWEEELDNLYVAEGLHAALVEVKPNLFTSPASCADTLKNMYPNVRDVSSDDMIKAIRQALSRNDEFPLTLVVLDEVQQYIGEDSQRSIDVQEMVEACSKRIGGRLMFIGTGQTAVTGTSNLKKLEGRFTIRVELSDADVDAVIRRVILAKKPEAREPIERMMNANLGEISRHLSGAGIAHRQDDIGHFAQDYPILPVRRRFWENTLRVMDQTGTDSQLRNQLSMIHKVIQTNLDQPLGHVVAADCLYFESADRLLQSRVLPRKVHERTMKWIHGSGDERLMARACGLVFLINRLNAHNQEIGVRATCDVIADLLVEDLPSGSGALRGALPALLDSCELLMKVDSEYRIQTEESSAWNDEFLNQRNSLASATHLIEAEREDRIRGCFNESVGRLSLAQGDSRTTRTIVPCFDAQLPANAGQHMYVWVRSGWNIDEQSVLTDARMAGDQSPTIFVFIPRRSADDLRHALIACKAAAATLDVRGVPATPEGIEARSAMETTKRTAEGRIQELLGDAFSGARVYQGGGVEIVGGGLRAMVLEAANNALQRLYPRFHAADSAGWSKVYDRSRKGDPDALKAVGYSGQPAENPVCKAILACIGGGKGGADIRHHFESSPYGWPGDAVDGGLLALLVAGIIRAQDEHGVTRAPGELERKAIGRTMFKVESVTISTAQRIQIRKLLHKAGITVNQGDELNHVPRLLQAMAELADRAGGEAPKPERPDTSILEDIRLAAGNDQLLALHRRREELTRDIGQWTDLRRRIDARWPAWLDLKRLMKHASRLQTAAGFSSQVEAIERDRQLLADPDPVGPLAAGLTQLLRDELNRLDGEYVSRHAEGVSRLEEDSNWRRLDPEQRYQLMSAQSLHADARPRVEVQTTGDVLSTLARCDLAMFADRVAALPTRFDEVAREAAALVLPALQFVRLPSVTLHSEAELDAWIREVRRQVAEALPKGPVAVRSR